MGHSRPLFSLFLSFQYTVDSKQMFNKYLNFCRWLYSNCGPLVSEATTLPTEPQPLPRKHIFEAYNVISMYLRLTSVLLVGIQLLCNIKHIKRLAFRAVVVAQLAERLLPISEDPGSNPVIGNFYWTLIYC